MNNTVREEDFIPHNVLPMTRERMKEREQNLAQRAKATKTITKGGARVVKVKVAIPIDQYAGLQRFEGDSDNQKINAIIRMANRRVDEWQREQAAKEQKGGGHGEEESQEEKEGVLGPNA